MAAQKREAGKNYIGLLSDDIETPNAVSLPVDSGRPIRNYVAGLMASLLNRRDNAR